MASEQTSDSPFCAQCEKSPAILECLDEELLYCAPCSVALHRKKARAHHTVKPFRTCDECEAAVARVQCIPCAGRQSDPLVFCLDCSGALHSRKARHHHQVEKISTSCSRISVTENELCKDGKVQLGASFNKTEALPSARIEKRAASEQGSLPSTEVLEEIRSSDSIEALKEAITQKEAHLPNVQSSMRHSISQTGTLNISTEEAALMNVREPPLHDATLGEADVNSKEEAPQKTDHMSMRSELQEDNPIQVPFAPVELSSLACSQKASQLNTQKDAITPTEDASSTCPIAKVCVQPAPVEKSVHLGATKPASMQEAMQNRTEGPSCGTMEASMERQRHGIESPSTHETIRGSANAPVEASVADGRASNKPGISHSIPQTQGVQSPLQWDHLHYSHHACSPHDIPCSYQNLCQGPHTPSPCRNHVFSQCTPPFLPRYHMAENVWPGRNTMEFTQNVFHRSPYNAGHLPPPCHSCAFVSAPVYMPFSSGHHTGFNAQADRSSSEYTPPIIPHGISNNTHSKSDDGPNSNKRVRSTLDAVNAAPPSDIQGEDPIGNVSKRIHVGEAFGCSNSMSQVHIEEGRKNPLSYPDAICSSEEQLRSHQTSSQGLSPLKKVKAKDSPREAMCEGESQSEISLSKVTSASKALEPLPSMLHEAHIEKMIEEVFEPLPERIPTSNSGDVCEQACKGGTQLHDELLPNKQVDPIRKECDNSLGSIDPAANSLEGSANTSTPSRYAAPLPHLPLEKDMPIRGPASSLERNIVSDENGPIDEISHKKPASENQSSGVLSERASGGTLPAEDQPKMVTANRRPKQELFDDYPDEEDLFDRAADTFPAGDATTQENGSLRRGTKGAIPKQELVLPESNAPMSWHRRMRPNIPSQVTHNDQEEETSRDSSESSPHEEDTSADDETFHQKKYRRGTVTLEAFATYGDAHDRSNKTIGHIYTMLKRGLRCNIPNADVCQALRDAQRQLTKYNLKQAGATEGSLENLEVLKPGSCVVDFVSTGSSLRGRLDCWTCNLAQTVAKYFATEYCSQKLKVVFFGITQNANCAGLAFAAIFNRISACAADYIPEKLLDEGDLIEIDRNEECPNKGVFSRKSRLAYKNELMEELLEIPKWQRGMWRAPKLERGKNASLCSTHSIWMEGIPKNVSLVKRYGHEIVGALLMHCRKACKNFVYTKNWTIIASRLRSPDLG